MAGSRPPARKCQLEERKLQTSEFPRRESTKLQDARMEIDSQAPWGEAEEVEDTLVRVLVLPSSVAATRVYSDVAIGDW